MVASLVSIWTTSRGTGMVPGLRYGAYFFFDRITRSVGGSESGTGDELEVFFGRLEYHHHPCQPEGNEPDDPVMPPRDAAPASPAPRGIIDRVDHHRPTINHRKANGTTAVLCWQRRILRGWRCCDVFIAVLSQWLRYKLRILS